MKRLSDVVTRRVGRLVASNDNEETRWVAVPYRCGACNHEWGYVCPKYYYEDPDRGFDTKVCPSCGTQHGILYEAFPVTQDDKVFRCSCGCVFNVITKKGFVCTSCGLNHRFDEME